MTLADTGGVRVPRLLGTMARAYAGVLFCESIPVGAWFALLTCAVPRAALVGVLSLIASMVWARALGLRIAGELHLTNSLLCGLYAGAFHRLDAGLVAWLALAPVAVALLSQWLSGVYWRLGKLPVLSLPFVLVSWITVRTWPPDAYPEILWPPLNLAGLSGTVADGFFMALGWLFLIPHPVFGALIFMGLIWASRYLAFLALAGYAAGAVTLEWMAQPGGVLVGFNFMLAAMAIGGLFTVPGRAGFTVAIAGAALSAWLGAALSAMLDPLHLPVLTLPFLLSTYLWLGALGGRPAGHAPQLSLDEPGLPEVTHERARLALARGAVPGSVPVFPPFYGEWRVTQAFDGPHTHQPPWAHAIDFDVPYESIRETGGVVASADFPCFGTPLVSPVAGEVVGLRDNLPDVDPGDVDTVNNWGNYLMLRVPGMQHVLLAHLKQGSLTVRQGEWVTAGQAVAACGSSGRSPVPHLHLHVQSSGQLGAPTLPFHLANVLVREKGGHREFRLCHVPSEGHLVSPAPREERIAAAMRLSAGSTLQYRLDRSGERQPELRELRAELTLLGQSRLRSNGEASVAFEDTASVMGFYDRRGPVDPLLDMWVLALGLTPYSAAAERWGDRPALRLVPLDPARRLIVTMLRPLGGGCESAYSRRWDDGAHAWIQRGDHRLKVLPGIEWSARTAAWIEPGVGIRRLELEMFGRRHSAELVAA